MESILTLTTYLLGIVDLLEHDKTLKKSWSSTAAREVSSCNGFTMPLGQNFFGRVGLLQCNSSPTIKHSRTALVCNSSFIHSHSSLIILHKSCGDGGMAKQQVEMTTGSCSYQPACRRPWILVVLSLNPRQWRYPAACRVTGQSFWVSAAHPHMREGVRKGTPNIAHPIYIHTCYCHNNGVPMPPLCPKLCVQAQTTVTSVFTDEMHY